MECVRVAFRPLFCSLVLFLFFFVYLPFKLLAYMGDGSKNEGGVGVVPVRDVLDFFFFACCTFKVCAFLCRYLFFSAWDLRTRLCVAMRRRAESFPGSFLRT